MSCATCAERVRPALAAFLQRFPVALRAPLKMSPIPFLEIAAKHPGVAGATFIRNLRREKKKIDANLSKEKGKAASAKTRQLLHSES